MSQSDATNDGPEETQINWAGDAPRGGKAVLGRILKENATVPLFFGQTLIKSLRDVGYNNTTSALCEHVDNAIQAGASQIRVLFRQTGRRGARVTDIAVYDNGPGMSANVLKVATSFGGSMSFGNRLGIGRFGMGMKTAALSMSPVLELYTWQSPAAVYNMTLDVEAVGRERTNLVELPNPELRDLRPEVAELFTKPMSFPSSADEQELLAKNPAELMERLGASGTIVYMPECDRLSYAKAQTLVDHAVREMSRVYRRAIGGGLRLYVNNRRVEASDPTYSMTNARHMRLDLPEKLSRLISAKSIDMPVTDGGSETAKIVVKIYRLPIEAWADLPRKTLKNDLKVFDGHNVSILRNDRELFAGGMISLTTRSHNAHWFRIQIDFPGELDEAFGVAANKQGVRLKAYVEQAIKNAIRDDVATLNDELRRFQASRNSEKTLGGPSEAERRAEEADPFQSSAMPSTALTPEEQVQQEANLRGLAVSVMRGGETEEQAFERVTKSTYIITRTHDEYHPFFDVKHKFGKVIMAINSAHPFFSELYEPVAKMGVAGHSSDGEGDDDGIAAAPETPSAAQVALDLLLLSLARTQSRLAGTSDDAKKLLDLMRREWSDTYRLQLKS